MNKNEIKKELMKSKIMAKFSHYTSGNLYYIVQLETGMYQFPISTVEDKVERYVEDMGGGLSVGRTRVIGLSLSSDLGTTNFDAEIKASFLNRWIDKAIDKEEFIKIG